MQGVRAGWALCAFVVGAAACSIDMNGLLDAPLGDDGGAHPPEAGTDATSVGEAGAGQDGSAQGDAAPPIDAGGEQEGAMPQDAGPAPVLYDGGSVALPDHSDTDWMGFCIGLTACFDAGTVSACMAQMPQPTDPSPLFPPPDVVSCVLNKGTDCAAMASCLGGASAPCNPQSTQGSCNGNFWQTCLLGTSISVDCGALGLVCSPGDNNPGCGFGDCYGWQQGQTVCVDPYVVECNQGRYEPHLDCQTFGLSCGGTPAQCQGDTSTCSNVDCPQLYQNGGFYCSAAGGAPVCQLGALCSSSQPDTCDPGGHQVLFCNAGVPAQYDCHAAKWSKDCIGGRCSN